MSASVDALVECPWFRWMPGMKLAGHDATYRLTYVWREPDVRARGRTDIIRGEHVDSFPVLQSGGPENFPGWGWPSPGSGWHPDIDDPATCGCFETLNREAWAHVGGGRCVEIEAAPRCRYDEAGRPVPLYAVRVLVLCDTWRLEWETPREEWQSTRGLALAHALLAAPTKGDGR